MADEPKPTVKPALVAKTTEEAKPTVARVSSDKTTAFPKGHILFRQGSKGGELFFILEGTVELSVRDEQSGKETVVAKKGDKSIIGTMSFLENDPRSATAKCTTDVKCIVVNQQQREKLLTQVPEWFKALLKDISASLRKTNDDYVRVAARNEVLERRVQIMKTKLGEMDDDDKPEPKKES